MMEALGGKGIVFDAVHIDEHFPKDNHPNRKPGIGMLTGYLDNEHYDLARSFTIGDCLTDVELAKNLGCKGILIAGAIPAHTGQGRLHIDAHHTIEDVGLALGTAFDKALGSKAGMERYGYATLPKDASEGRLEFL